MNHLDYWSEATNPESGAKFEDFKCMLEEGSNGKADVDRLVAGAYGEELTKRMLIKQKCCFDPQPDAATEEYFRSLGLAIDVYDDGDYYARWTMFVPLEAKEADNKAKFPLIICDIPVGPTAIECGLAFLAGKEKFAFVCPQNTNWDSVPRQLMTWCDNYPIDRERIYITGFSYGGYQATATCMRQPWLFAACAPCGNIIWRDWDNWREPFTEAEIETLRHVRLPFVQLVGQFEASNFAPVNTWAPREHTGPRFPRKSKPGKKDPRAIPALDPTICPQRKLPDGRVIGTPVEHMPHPAEGEDKHLWALGLLNKRMYAQGCQPRDINTCLGYLDTPEDELHHVTGFYADEEKIEYYYGHKHYVANMFAADGMNTFRYVVWENGVHMFPISLGKIIWDFFKMYRRDAATGKIVVDPYCAATED